ncbi:MAG: AMP-binding protein [Schwartzia sp.]|nr:AMP-binding protein [Schwartzia sp. (in: firmicutes)]
MLVHDILRRGRDNDDAVYSTLGGFTYLGLRVAAENCRRRLYAAGVRIHDRVAIYSRNRAEFIAAYMAISALGAVVVPINFQLSMRETAFILKNADVRVVIVDKPLPLDAAISALDYESVTQIDIGEAINPTTLPPPPPLPKDFGPDEPCAIIYTSGTTGSPKGAVLSHRNLVMNAIDMQQQVHIARHDNVLCVLPMYHCFAWTCAVMAELSVGATITILDSFTPKKTIDVTRALKVTIIVMVPSILSLVTKLGTPEDLKSLRYVILGGTKLPLHIADAFINKFHLPIVEGYGLSEASPVVTMNAPEATRAGSVGPAIPDVRVRIVDENGHDVKTGERGELLVQGPNVMHGYFKLPEETAKTLRDGWLHTGDVACMDEDGYVYIVDRIKDMIISMGENIYPREIEELIYSFPGIHEAAVIAIEDKLRGQAGCCYYSVQPDGYVEVRALKKYLQQNLALFKIPREFRQIDELPKTSTGKIAKKELEKLYAAEG